MHSKIVVLVVNVAVKVVVVSVADVVDDTDVELLETDVVN